MRSSGLSQSSTVSTSSGVVVGSPLTTRSTRKRRASSPSLMQCSDGPPLRQKFATPAGLGAAGPIYDDMKNNSTFLANIMQRLPSFDVRQMARVATDWTSIAYSELRRRAGNRPFNLLWNVRQSGIPISLRSHFHKAWLVGNGPNVRPVKTILSFGNLAIESELVKDDDGTLSNCPTQHKVLIIISLTFSFRSVLCHRVSSSRGGNLRVCDRSWGLVHNARFG
jgi:hypothetical protein